MFETRGHGKFRSWRLSGNPQVVECDDTLLYDIVVRVVEGFWKFPRGGIEVGGVLFGEGDRHLVRILAARPIECEYADGPSFLLSDTDHDNLAFLLEGYQDDPDLAGLVPVGWYHSNTRTELTMRAPAMDVHQRHFPEPWQIAFIFRPENSRPVAAGIFVRDIEGRLSPQPTLAVDDLGVSSTPLLNSHRSRSTAPETAAGPTVTVEPEVGEAFDQGEHQEDAAAQAGVDTSEETQVPHFSFGSFPAAEKLERKRGLMRWLTVLAASAALAVGAWAAYRWLVPPEYWTAAGHFQEAAGDYAKKVKNYWLSALAPEPPPPLSVRAFAEGEQLVVRWNPASNLVSSASGAAIELHQGESVKTLQLSTTDLRKGFVTYPGHGGNAGVKLSIFLSGGGAISETTRFLASAAPPPIENLDDAAAAAAAEAEAESLRRSLRMQGEESRALASTLATLREVAASRAAMERRESPPVTLSEARPGLATNSQPPGVRPASVMLEQQPGSAPSGSSARPVPPSPPPVPAAPAASAGKLIWTGYLQDGQSLTIRDGRPSAGSLSGRLPGKPVQVHAYPAELTGSGLTVYSGRSKHRGTQSAEPPGPENAWNRTEFRYDSKLAGSLELGTTPSGDNNWNMLAVRAVGRPLTVIVIEWESQR